MKTQHDIRVAIAFLDNCEDRKPVNYDLKWQGVVNLLADSEERAQKDGRAFVPAEFGVRNYTGKDGWGHAAVFPKDDGRWAFSCCHTTCKERGRGWRDFADLVAPKSSVISEEFKLGFGRRRGQA